MEKEIKPLPAEELIGEKYPDIKGRIKICSLHTRDEWTKGTYEQNPDGSITCIDCGWGTRIPGFMKLLNGKIMDLRIASS